MESPTSLLAAATHSARTPPRVPRPRRPRLPIAFLVFALTLLAAAAPAAAAERRTLSLVSDGPFALDPDIPAFVDGVSDDGSRLFLRTSEVMVGTDTDAQDDVYVRTATGALLNLSDTTSGQDAQLPAFLDHMTADGTHVFIETRERLLATDTDTDSDDVYERTPTGALVHITDNPTGPDAEDARVRLYDVTRDGTRVYFEADEPFAATDTDSEVDVYERGPGGVRHLSDNPTGPDADIEAELAGVSPDGARVYFETEESLADSDTDTAWDVYMRTAAGALVHITDDPTGPDADVYAEFVGERPDGGVWFATPESMAATDTDTAVDVYGRAPAGALTHATRNPRGPEGAYDAHADDDWLTTTGALFFTTVEPLAASDTDTALDAYQRTPSGAIVHLSDGRAGPDANVDARISETSADGTRVVIETLERLTSSDTDASLDYYERLPTGALIHVTDDPTGPDDALAADEARLARDGSRFVFATRERLAATDTDTAWDLYEHGPGGLRHVSDDPTGPDANLDASAHAISPDGRRVYVATSESLSPADTDTVQDIYQSTAVPVPPARPPAPQADTTPPRLTRPRVLARRSTIRFTLSEPARVRVIVRRGGRVRRSVAVSGRAGLNQVRLRPRLPAGRYRVTITATDAAGNRSLPRRLALRIVRRPR